MLIGPRSLWAACLLLLYLPVEVSAASPAAVFVKDGQLLIVDDDSSSVVRARNPQAIVAEVSRPVSNYWGTLEDGRLLVTLQGDLPDHTLSDDDHHCSVHSHPEQAWLVKADGTFDTELSTDTLRVFPSLAGGDVALISPERDLSIWRDGKQISVTSPGRVSNAGWSPDGRYLVVSVFPPDWSEGAVSAASTNDEFLRLQNADLYLFDARQMTYVTQLTDDPGTEYGPFFSPNGESLYYIWLHLTEDQGGLMRLYLDRDEGTSASAPAVQLTNAGNDPGETPLGRVGTYVWRRGGTQLVFESGLPDGSGEIWTMSAQGQGAVRIDAGRKPQPVGDAEIIFMNSKGAPETVTLDVRP